MGKVLEWRARVGDGVLLSRARQKVDIAALCVEIRRRTRVLPAAHVDPLRAIYQHCAAMLPGSAERRTLEQLALAITQGSVGAIDENEVWKLGPVVLGLLDALIERTTRGIEA